MFKRIQSKRFVQKPQVKKNLGQKTFGQNNTGPIILRLKWNKWSKKCHQNKKKIWPKNSFGPKIFFSDPKSFLDPPFFRQFFLTQNILWPKIFWAQNIWDALDLSLVCLSLCARLQTFSSILSGRFWWGLFYFLILWQVWSLTIFCM